MNSSQTYRDRWEAGEVLAAFVRQQIGTPGDAVVLALPRGGVPVGFGVARALAAEFDVMVVRKLGAPGFGEYAIGAIATGGFHLWNREAIEQFDLTEKQIEELAERETLELRRRERLYRANRPPVRMADRVVILVDDGLATGFSMRAAIAAVRERAPRRLVVAVPVGAPTTCDEIQREVDTLVCPLQPDPFQAVGRWYQDFGPTSDEEVCECLSSPTNGSSRVGP